jgi:hypothetical protein
MVRQFLTLTALLLMLPLTHDRPAQAHGGNRHREIAAVRKATAKYHRIKEAIEDGYAPFGGCFSDPMLGGMGYHYANAELMADPAVDPLRPELLVYESRRNGKLRLVAVEYLTFQAAWHAAGNVVPPSLFAHTFHVNATLLDEPFYLLHAWVWRRNPRGMFFDWNPRVGCP